MAPAVAAERVSPRSRPVPAPLPASSTMVVLLLGGPLHEHTRDVDVHTDVIPIGTRELKTARQFYALDRGTTNYPYPVFRWVDRR